MSPSRSARTAPTSSGSPATRCSVPGTFLDIIDAPDLASATRVSVLVRSYGHAHTEVWPAVPWPEFKTLVRDLPARP